MEDNNDAKIARLYVELLEAKKEKKAAAKHYGENCKRIEEEIESILRERDEDAAEAAGQAAGVV